MNLKNIKKSLFNLLLIIISFNASSQAWVDVGSTYSRPSPYHLNYFLLLDLDGYNGDVSAEFEVLVLADDNYMYHSRYSIFASRHSGTTTGRLDGVTMNYLSGRPEMLEVVVKRNQIWIKASKKWGSLKYRLITERGLGNWKIPLTKAIIRPDNIIASSEYSFYYDFDAGKFNHLLAQSASGNVGIGTSPNSEYVLAANGTIRAKEIKVEADWADFVFKDEYQLMELSELEEFIQENGHLPDIPTEKEVEAEGISLGEMNSKLLQKIEELSLHLIELNKILKKQSEEINHLKTKCK